MSTIDKIVSNLINKNISIAVAESCTGGLIAHTLTKYSGISKIFSTGIVCYSNQTKVKYLSISKKTLNKFGAVSEEIALEMIKNLYKKEKSQICISTTGIAGPKGGSKAKPVGLVFVGLRYKNKEYVFKKNFKGTRLDIQRKTKKFVFNQIKSLI